MEHRGYQIRTKNRKKGERVRVAMSLIEGAWGSRQEGLKREYEKNRNGKTKTQMVRIRKRK